MKLFSRELIIPILIAIIVFLAVAMPSLRQEKMTSTVIGNNDIANYALNSKIVKEIPKTDIAKALDFTRFQDETIGGFMNTAFFCSVVKLEPYQVQNISLCIFFIVSLLLTYLLAREVFHYSGFTANVVSLLYGLNSVLFYLVSDGFENQIIAMALMLLIMFSNIAIIRANGFKDALRYFPFLFLALWGLSLTYNHMLVIIYGLIIAYLLVSWWKNRKAARLVNWAAISGIALLLMICFSPHRLPMIISNTFAMSSVSAGWFISWISPEKLYGITPFFSDGAWQKIYSMASFIGPGMFIATLIITILIIIVIISGFIKLFKSDVDNFILAASIFVLVFMGALILACLNIPKPTNGGFGGYNQFKLISFFIPLILLGSFVLFRDVSVNIRNRSLLNRANSDPKHINQKKKTKISSYEKKNSLYLILIALLIIANSMSAGVMRYYAIRTGRSTPSDTINLQVIRDNPEIKSVNIPSDGSTYWNIMWETYFLFPKKLYFEPNSYPSYYNSSTLDGEWWLVRNTGLSSNTVLSVIGNDDVNIIKVNSTYELRKDNKDLSAKFGKGWSDNEGGHRWTDSNDSSIIISASDKTLVELNLMYTPLNKANSLSIYLNSVKIMDYSNNTGYTIKGLSLKKGENILEFRARLPAELPGNGDPRKLGYSFGLIQIQEVK